MENKTLNRIKIITAVLLLCALALIGYILVKGTAISTVGMAVKALTCIAGAWYLFMGCKKKIGFVLYQGYFCLLGLQILLLLMAVTGVPTLFYVLMGIELIAAVLLAGWLNMGEIASKIAAFAILACGLAHLVRHLVSGTVNVPAVIADVILGIASVVLVYGKYADKKARGKK